MENVSFFKHLALRRRRLPSLSPDKQRRSTASVVNKVEHKDGTSSMAWAEMKKTIYSLDPLRELLLAANRRYLEFISTIEDDRVGTGKLNKIESLARGEFNINGFQNKDLRRQLRDRTSGQISRTMKRLRVHGLVKKVGRTYKYYLTALGKQIIALGLKLKELYIIPALSAAPAR